MFTKRRVPNICFLLPLTILISFVCCSIVSAATDDSNRYRDDSSVFAPGYLNAAKHDAESIVKQQTPKQSMWDKVVAYVQGKTAQKAQESVVEKPRPVLQQKQSSGGKSTAKKATSIVMNIEGLPQMTLSDGNILKTYKEGDKYYFDIVKGDDANTLIAQKQEIKLDGNNMTFTYVSGQDWVNGGIDIVKSISVKAQELQDNNIALIATASDSTSSIDVVNKDGLMVSHLAFDANTSIDNIEHAGGNNYSISLTDLNANKAYSVGYELTPWQLSTFSRTLETGHYVDGDLHSASWAYKAFTATDTITVYAKIWRDTASYDVTHALRLSVFTGPVVDANGNPVVDEAGNPVSNTTYTVTDQWTDPRTLAMHTDVVDPALYGINPEMLGLQGLNDSNYFLGNITQTMTIAAGWSTSTTPTTLSIYREAIYDAGYTPWWPPSSTGTYDGRVLIDSGSTGYFDESGNFISFYSYDSNGVLMDNRSQDPDGVTRGHRGDTTYELYSGSIVEFSDAWWGYGQPVEGLQGALTGARYSSSGITGLGDTLRGINSGIFGGGSFESSPGYYDQVWQAYGSMGEGIMTYDSSQFVANAITPQTIEMITSITTNTSAGELGYYYEMARKSSDELTGMFRSEESSAATQEFNSKTKLMTNATVLDPRQFDTAANQAVLADIFRGSAVNQSTLAAGSVFLDSNGSTIDAIMALKSIMANPTEDQKAFLSVTKALLADLDKLMISEGNTALNPELAKAQNNLIQMVANVLIAQAIPDLLKSNDVQTMKAAFSELNIIKGKIVLEYAKSTKPYYDNVTKDLSKNMAILQAKSILSPNMTQEELDKLPPSELDKILEKIRREESRAFEEDYILQQEAKYRKEYLDPNKKKLEEDVKKMLNDFTQKINTSLTTAESRNK